MRPIYVNKNEIYDEIDEIQSTSIIKSIAASVAAGTAASYDTNNKSKPQNKVSNDQKNKANKVKRHLSEVTDGPIKKIANKSNDNDIKRACTSLLVHIDNFRKEYTPKRSLMSKLSGDANTSSKDMNSFTSDINEMRKLALVIEKSLADKVLKLEISEFIVVLRDLQSAMNNYHKEFGTIVTKSS